MTTRRSEAERLMQTMIDETFFADTTAAQADVETLCRVAAVTPDWLRARIDAGLLAPAAPRIDVEWLQRVRCMVRVESDFDAVPELAALVADLEDEIHHLRRRLQRVGVGH
ncbi:MAG: MerR family transcriptional regulator [Rubrivivax sp.]